MASKKIVVPTLLLGLSLVLCACGGTGNPSSSQAAVSSDTTSDAINLTFWQTNGAGLQNAFESYAKKFSDLVKTNENVTVNIEVSYQGGYDDIEKKIKNGFSTGDVPTLAIAYPDHVADYLAMDVQNRGYVVNLANYINDDKIGFGKESWLGDGAVSDFVPAFYSEGTKYAKAGVYSLPFMKSSEVLFYNADRVLAYGKNYTPTGTAAPLSTKSAIEAFLKSMTWDQFMDFCAYIKAQDTGKTLVAPAFYDADENLFISQSYQQDIPYLSIKSDGTCSVDFNNDQAKAMVKSLKKNYDDGLFVTKGTQGVYGSQNFVDQKTLFSIGSSGGTGYQDPKGTFNAAAVKVPYAGTKPLYVSQGPTLAILNNTSLSNEVNALRAKYAFKFVKYLTSTAVNTVLCANFSEGYSPVRTSCYSSEAYQNFLVDNEDTLIGKAAQVVTNDLSDKYLWSPAVKGSSKARDEVGGIITQVLMNKKTVDQAFSDAYQQTELNV